jgi:replicative DNA helicase
MSGTSILGERTPPYSADAEKAVLGCAIIEPRTFDDIAGAIKVDDFFLPAHREIFEALLELDRQGQPFDIIALVEEMKRRGFLSRLEGGETYLLTLMNAVPTTSNVTHYIHIVRSRAAQRRLIVAAAEIMAAAYGDHYDVGDLLTSARGKMAAIESPSDEGPMPLCELLDPALEEIEKRAANPEQHFVLSGIQALDREVSALCAETLVFIAGRPSKGKSALLFNFALRASKNKIPTLVFSLEMNKLLLVFRALAFESLVNGHSINSGRLSGPEWVRLQSAASRLATSPVSIDDRSMTRFGIASEARKWRASLTSPQAVILIDYLGMVKKTGTAASTQEELGDITADMKGLAKELKVPVVLAAQLNRDSEKENRRPQLKDLRGSGAIEQDADVVIFPWWQGEAPRYGRHPASLIVGKNRNGATADIAVDWIPEYTMFADREDLEEPQQRSFA